MSLLTGCGDANTDVTARMPFSTTKRCQLWILLRSFWAHSSLLGEMSPCFFSMRRMCADNIASQICVLIGWTSIKGKAVKALCGWWLCSEFLCWWQIPAQLVVHRLCVICLHTCRERGKISRGYKWLIDINHFPYWCLLTNAQESTPFGLSLLFLFCCM